MRSAMLDLQTLTTPLMLAEETVAFLVVVMVFRIRENSVTEHQTAHHHAALHALVPPTILRLETPPQILLMRTSLM